MDTRVTDLSTTEATAAQMYRTLAAAVDAPDPTLVLVEAWRRHAHIHTEGQGDAERWRRWWDDRGASHWAADTSTYDDGRRVHHYLTGQWRGWTISLTWIVTVTPTTCPCGAPAEIHRQHDGTTTVVCAATQSREEEQ